MKLLYIANIRLPTERAHGLQIVQNCEAFADAGAEVSLWIARRVNTAELRAVRDVWSHYGVKRNFALRRLFCIDLLPLVPGRTDQIAQLMFGLQLATFTLVVLIASLFSDVDIFYSRDPLVLFCLSFVKPRDLLVYEAHMSSEGRAGRLIQRRVLRHTRAVFTTTRHLADELIADGADPARVQVAHDGIRAGRFEGMPDRATARARLGLPDDAFLVGYVGRFEAVGLDKGVGLLADAAACASGVGLLLVGGPEEAVDGLRLRWHAQRGSDESFCYAGQVAPEEVPGYLAACDVCAIPSPPNSFFAHHSSPMKLFEYMAARRAILASDLPAIREVVRDGETAFLLPPTDGTAWVEAIQRLRDDPDLRTRLADAAYALVMEQYTWDARARRILETIGSGGEGRAQGE